MKFSLKQKIAIVFLLLAIVFLGIVQYLMPKQVDWNISLSKTDSQPYGCEILYQRISDIFSEVRYNDQPYFSLDTNDRNKLLFIVSKYFTPNKDEIKDLLEYISLGNTVYLVANDVSTKLSDTLNIKIKGGNVQTSLHLLFLEGDEYKVATFNSPYGIYKEYIEYSGNTVPRVLTKYEDGGSTAIQVPINNGSIIIDIASFMYTNYTLLYQSPQYAESMLSQTGTNSIIWDDYFYQKGMSKGTLLAYILKNQSLLSAYLIVLFTFLLAMYFGFRRVARPIPVIEPLRNASADLAFSIGMLWYNQQNHKVIALRKWKYVKEQIYEKTKLQWKSDAQTIELIASKLGKDKQLLFDIDVEARSIESGASINSETLKDFYLKTKKLI